MKFLKHTVWSLIVASMMTACMGFDEINVDPDKTNRPTPGMLATQILFSMMDSRSNSSEGFANHCMLSKHIACGEKIRDYAYNRIGRTGFGAYTSLIEAEKMVECAAEVEKPAYRALAHFVRAYNLFYLTMRVGDIPYSEALGGEKGNFTPRYDTQKDVSRECLTSWTRLMNCSRRRRLSQVTSSSAASPTSGCAWSTRSN